MPKYITRAAHAKWNERVKEINRDLQGVYDEIGEAALMGDLKENSEYQFACEKRDRMGEERNRIQKSLSEIRGYIEDVPFEKDVAGLGTYVKFVRDSTEEELEYCILGTSDDENPLGDVRLIVYEAPLAQQLMGKAVGDIFDIRLPAWEDTVELLEVKHLFPKTEVAE